MSQDDVLAEIEAEVKKSQQKAGKEPELEIEIEEEPIEQKAEEPEQPEQKPEEPQESEEEYSKKVQSRIKKLVDQRRQAELQTRQYQEQVAQMQARLERLEQGNTHRAETDFNQRYDQTKQALAKAFEEGDTEAQVNFSEQLADMRAAMRIAELQKKQQEAAEAQSPTVGRAQQQAQRPAPQKAMQWWESNRWFKTPGYERETNAARSIDVQLEIEGYDQNSDEYYEQLNNRLQKIFPELKSGTEEPSKPKEKSRSPVAPTAGGPMGYKGNRVRMSQDQLKMARELGIRDEKSLKLYADEIRKQNRS